MFVENNFEEYHNRKCVCDIDIHRSMCMSASVYIRACMYCKLNYIRFCAHMHIYSRHKLNYIKIYVNDTT